jgi:hypothetical protein
MPDSDANNGSNLTTLRGQSIDVLALQAELTRLRGENARLRAALAGTRDGATVATLSGGGQTPQEPSEQSALSPRERVELFRRLFRGRTDTFPVRWHSATSGKSGYAPACSNEWVPGVCEKPRVKCTDCENRKFIALPDQVIFEHLTGKLTAGIYPLLQDDTCRFVVADFDEAEWRIADCVPAESASTQCPGRAHTRVHAAPAGRCLIIASVPMNEDEAATALGA